jgi:hypothetical protein
VEHLALSDDAVCQLDGSPIQEYHVDPVRLEDASQLVGKARLNASPVDGSINQNGQVIVAHWPEIALHMGAKQIDQAHTVKSGQYG